MLRHEVREVLDALADAGIEGVCAGGAAQDALLGKTPKDYDIVLLNTGGHGKALAAVNAVLRFDPSAELLYGTGSNETHDVEFVIKLTYNGATIDIIQNVTVAHTPDEVCAQFDYNICCAYFDEQGCPVVSPLFDRVVRPVHGSACAERLMYLLEKYGRYYNFGTLIDVLGMQWFVSAVQREISSGQRVDVYTRYITNIEFPSEPLED